MWINNTVGSGLVICIDGQQYIGRCGGRFLASGATQSGFGRTGSVDWCTTAKTSPFTAVNGDGYFVNTTSGAVTVTLPAVTFSWRYSCIYRLCKHLGY